MSENGYGESYDLQWEIGTTMVYATFAKPRGVGPFPVVVMAAGSGPTDRDWTSPLLPGSNGSARLLADALAQAGIASLRYDKRASGAHAMENMKALVGRLSMQSHVDEFTGAVDTLVARPDIDSGRIFGLGNSEGTLHVLNYHLSNPSAPLAGLVLTGVPGRAVGPVARSQLAAQAALIPNGEALLALYDQAIERFLRGEPAAPASELPDGVKDLFRSLEAPANQPFSRELWIADGASLLANVDSPVLVIIGKKDIQVDWRLDGELLQKAAQGKSGVTFFYPDDANHILKYEAKNREELTASEVVPLYNEDGRVLDSSTVDAIVTWLHDHGA